MIELQNGAVKVQSVVNHIQDTQP